MALNAENADWYDVFISYQRSDIAWAERLANDLSQRKLSCFYDQHIIIGEPLAEALNRALDRSRVLVVLWSSATRESSGVLTEIAGFSTLVRHRDEPGSIIPIVLGGPDLLSGVPDIVISRQAMFLGQEAYAADPDSGSPQWMKVLQAIEDAVSDSRAGHGSDASAYAIRSEPVLGWPEFSTAARRALSFAFEMVGSSDSDTASVRTAALLGALHASVIEGMSPTTGDVVRLVLGR